MEEQKTPPEPPPVPTPWSAPYSGYSYQGSLEGQPPPTYYPYPYPVFPYQPSSPRPLNSLALAALLIAAFGLLSCPLTGIPAVIMGHIARRQIRKNNESGDGLAIATLIIGWIEVALVILGIAVMTVLIVFFPESLEE